ncbi:MAG: hypothetical protein IIX92_03985 [Selenomonadales bacterium]|nr:hypothetical protein [Selenomonadales bacterium]MBQ2114162.1 hypothetical protein [Selenomonadales bacterium]MBQ2246659.1 hypothetical protein [Selenomonadales bacterium]MBQ5587562.1 hypothetical protein [Selenomonadales bacterium]MBQ5636731.1 hypothetical protein [Selenomonadales bacterium]
MSTLVTAGILAVVAFGCYKGFKKIFTGNTCDCDKSSCGCGCSSCPSKDMIKK